MKLIKTTYEMHTHTQTLTVEQLNNKCADPSKWPYSGVTFLESAHRPVKHMIKVVTSR